MKLVGVVSLFTCAFLALVASPPGRRGRDRDPERDAHHPRDGQPRARDGELLPARPHVARLRLRRRQRAPAEPDRRRRSTSRRTTPAAAASGSTSRTRAVRTTGRSSRGTSTGCKASDGSYWALQMWQRMLPNVGYVPWTHGQKVWEVHVSHWTGEIAQLEAYSDWVYAGRFHEVFGQATYRGRPVFGYRTTKSGNPLDTYGRLIFLDTFNSAYGQGWRRENSFVAHNPSGMFCYGFYPYSSYGSYPPQRSIKLAGNGKKLPPHALRPGRHTRHRDVRRRPPRLRPAEPLPLRLGDRDDVQGQGHGRRVGRPHVRSPLNGR